MPHDHALLSIASSNSLLIDLIVICNVTTIFFSILLSIKWTSKIISQLQYVRDWCICLIISYWFLSYPRASWNVPGTGHAQFVRPQVPLPVIDFIPRGGTCCYKTFPSAIAFVSWSFLKSFNNCQPTVALSFFFIFGHLLF